MSSVKLPLLDLKLVAAGGGLGANEEPTGSMHKPQPPTASSASAGGHTAASSSAPNDVDVHPSSSNAGRADIAPPSLSHLVAASLSNAAAHERAIQKWTRDIQREMDEYRHAQLMIKNGGQKEKKKKASQQLGRVTNLDPLHPSSGSSSARRPMRDSLYSSTMAGFLRDDIQNIHPKSKARFYPTKLVTINSAATAGTSSAHTERSRARQRDTSPIRAAAAAKRAGQQAGSPSRPGHKANVHPSGAQTARNGRAGVTEQKEEIPAAGSPGASVAPIYEMFGTPLSPQSSSPSTTTAEAIHAALLTLPPALSAEELQPSLTGGDDAALDEAAAFRSPALYMDLKMRQLFADSTLSSSQKAHVVVHLLDVLGELVEPDSQAAYQTLTDTIKELILSSEYKNLIPVNGYLNGSSSGAPTLHSPATQVYNATPLSKNKHANSMVALHKDLSRRNKSQWTTDGNAFNILPKRDYSQTLSQSLADGSMDTNAAVGKSLSKLGRDRQEIERLEGEYLAAARGNNLNRQQYFQSGIQDFESRKKPIPSIAFEGDIELSFSKQPTVLPTTGNLPYRTLLPAPFNPAHVLHHSLLSNFKQIPAAFLEIAFSLKSDVESLCERLNGIVETHNSQIIELTRYQQEASFLHEWSTKKSLQLNLFHRSELNLSSEIIILKNLLVDLKEEFESINEENILLEEDYLAHGLVFGGSFAMEQFRLDEETRNYPLELKKKKKEMDTLQASIEHFKKDLNEIHMERDLLLTRIEVLEQAVNMMHNDSDEEDDEDEEGDDDDSADEPAKKSKDKEKEKEKKDEPTFDPNGYPFKQQAPDDLRGRGISNTSVPIFLRFNGWYPNLNYSKQDVEVRIKELWSLKTIADEKAKQVGGKQTDLKEYFIDYLNSRFKKDGAGSAHKKDEEPDKTKEHDGAAGVSTSLQSSASASHLPTSPSSSYALEEFVLNFFTTLEHHFVDQDFVLFLKVILGELNESHYRDQMQMLANFKDAIFRWDQSEHTLYGGALANKEKEGDAAAAAAASASTPSSSSLIDGLISKQVFINGLYSFFPYKNERHMRELIAILERDCMTNGQVDGRKILSDGEGDLEVEDFDALPSSSSTNSDSTPTYDPISVVDPSALTDVEPSGGIYTSNFLECLRHQYLVEIEEFTARIRGDLYKLYEIRKVERAKDLASRDEYSNTYSAIRNLERGETKPPSLTAYDIRCVLRAADMHRSTEELTDFLRRGCNEPYLSKDTEIQLEKFMKNLVETGLVHTTNHWRRIPAKMPSLAMLQAQSEEDRQAIATATHAAAEAFSSASHSSSGSSLHRPWLNRRASMEDEGSFFAARAGGLHSEAAPAH